MIKRILPLIVLLTFLFTGNIFAVGTTTPNSGLYKPAVDDIGWGALVNANMDTLDSYVYAHSYATINAAVAAASSQTIFVSTAMTMIANVALTVTKDIAIVVIDGGSITKNGTSTMIINGPFGANVHQVFIGFNAGDITFGNRVTERYPEWWGENITPDSTDMSTEIQVEKLYLRMIFI
jgi:hypothetical protein